MKQSFKQLTRGNIAILVIGAKFTPEMATELRRSKEMGAVIIGSPSASKAFETLGVSVKSFLVGADATPLKYPNSGSPVGVVAQIMATSEEQVSALKGTKPFNIVVTEINDTTGVMKEGTTFEEVRGSFHHNTVDVINKANVAGRIVCTNSEQLQQVLDYIEQEGEMTEEVYDTIATMYWYKSQTVVLGWIQNLTRSANTPYKAAKAKLKEFSFYKEGVKA